MGPHIRFGRTQRKQFLHRALALVAVGHDEYWTADQLDAVRDFRDSGDHTVFLGGNLALSGPRNAR
ncbi:N,N-dimethylformamidase beta subunit family domain-containing protein [Mesorhizobium sp. M1312]|uniref:N,N-dimethylformamidase beta subunit family domain-containing protein n=1 Tax=unclassified Mesorhizobium TaxID=325217 RepID=UPI003337B567